MSNDRICPGCGHYTQRATQELCLICTEGIRIPAEDVKPALQKIIQERHYQQVAGQWTGGATVFIEELSADPKTYVHSKLIYEILNDKPRAVQWNTVDKILSKAGMFHLWYQPPLAQWFHEPREAPKRRPPRKSVCKCGEPKNYGSKQCGVCYKARCKEKRESQKCRCGAKLSWKSVRCQKCYYDDVRSGKIVRRQKTIPACVDCGGPCYRGARRCRECYKAAESGARAKKVT